MTTKTTTPNPDHRLITQLRTIANKKLLGNADKTYLRDAADRLEGAPPFARPTRGRRPAYGDTGQRLG